MYDMNQVTLMGRLGHQPVRRSTKDGKAIATFSLATTRVIRSPGDPGTGIAPSAREETYWHKIVAWDRLAETCLKYLDKGNTILLEGDMRPQAYTDKSGVRRISVEVHMDKVNFINVPRIKRPEGEGARTVHSEVVSSEMTQAADEVLEETSQAA